MALLIIKIKKDSPEIIIITATTMEAFCCDCFETLVVEVPCWDDCVDCTLDRSGFNTCLIQESRLSRFTKYVVVYSTNVSTFANRVTIGNKMDISTSRLSGVVTLKFRNKYALSNMVSVT